MTDDHPPPPDGQPVATDGTREALQWGVGLLEETYDALLIWEPGGVIRFWNRGAEELYGYTRDEAVGRVVHDILQGAPRTGTMPDVEAVLWQRGRWEGELARTSKFGGQVVTESRLLVARRADGLPYVVEANRDVTLRREAEDALRRSEAMTTAVLDASLDAIVGMDHRGRITSFNAAAEQLFGWRREEVIGRDMGEIIIPEHLREAHRTGIRRYLETREPRVLGRRIEIEALRRNGATFPVELAIVQLPDVEPPQFTGFLRDIGPQKQREIDLRRANEELEARAAEERALRTVAERLTAAAHVPEMMQQIVHGALVVSSAAGAYVERVVSPDGEVEVVAGAGEGTPPLGTRAAYPGSLTEEVIERRAPVFLTQLIGLGASMAPYLVRHCSGCSVLVVPLLAGAQVLGALVLLRASDQPAFEFGVVNRARTLGDLASLALQRVMVLDEAERRRDEAVAAVRTRDEVLSVVSHDLRNPVATVSMSASLLLDPEIRLADQQRRTQLEVIQRSAKRMERLIQDLLDVTRMEARRFSIRCRPERADTIAREACESFRSVLEAKGQVLACEIPEALPSVDADRDRVLQVLSNFLGNAAKFTPAGGRITVRAAVADGEVQFTVTDEGPGIPEEELPRLFQRFWQAKRTAHLGAGLGLAIAKGIAEAHHGRVWVESQVGRGSTFGLGLPAK